MTKKYHYDLGSSTKCWIYKKEYNQGEIKVKDHGHITGKRRVSAYQDCNLKN